LSVTAWVVLILAAVAGAALIYKLSA